jgi:hypothetical protein
MEHMAVLADMPNALSVLAHLILKTTLKYFFS